MEKTKNFGVILGERITDYRAGRVAGALPFEERNPSGDWEPVLPAEERQFNDNGDSMSCVTFAETNGLEVQEKAITKVEPNYSDRWIAKMSGTTREGNYLWKVADAIRKYGLVKESSYPVPSGKWTWEKYHEDIPEPLLSQLKAEGQEWLKKWDVKYEFVDFNKESLMRHLKMAPLTVVIPGHAILNFRTTKELIYYFDTYPPHKKATDTILSAVKLVLYPKELAIPDNHLLVDIKYLDVGKQVQKLINALVANGWNDCKDWLLVYDERLSDYVLKFQLANLPRLSWSFFWAFWYYKGKLVDQTTRDILNKQLK